MNDVWFNQPDSLDYDLIIFRQLDRLGIIAAQGKSEEFFVGVEILEKILSPRIDSEYDEFAKDWKTKYDEVLKEYRARRVKEGSRALEDFMRKKIELALEKLDELMKLMDRVAILPQRGAWGIIDASVLETET